MTKEDWIKRAASLIDEYADCYNQNYAEALYQTYVVEDDQEWTPDEAVSEDMNYWEE